MKLGLDSYSYHLAAGIWGYRPSQPLSVEDYLDLAASLGLAGVQFADVRHFASLDAGYLRELRERAEASGLYIEFGTGGTSPEKLKPALEACRHLGCCILRTFVGARRREPNPPLEAQIARAAADLAEIAPQAEDLGVKIAIENHQDLTSGELLALLERVDHPAVGVCLDTGNSLAVLEDPLAAAENLAAYTFTTHMKDYRLIRSAEGFWLIGCGLGEGDVDLPGILQRLRAAGPVRDLHLNIEAPLEKIPVRLLRREFWQGFEEVKARDLAPLLRLAWEDREEILMPWEQGMDEAAMLACEDRQVRRSVAYLRALVEGTGGQAADGAEGSGAR